MYKITKEDLYEKRDMKTRRKVNSTFNCPTCKETVSIKTHTYFYIATCKVHIHDRADAGLFCSTDCYFKHLESLGVDINEYIEEHNAFMDKLYFDKDFIDE